MKKVETLIKNPKNDIYLSFFHKMILILNIIFLALWCNMTNILNHLFFKIINLTFLTFLKFDIFEI